MTDVGPQQVDARADPRPLEGVRVVECCSYVTGPFTATMLADLGAEVIKVEPPGGDAFRRFGHCVNGWSALWTSTNRGKQSIVLDLKNATDLQTMRQLLEAADVLVENWRPHVAASLGLSQDLVSQWNPALIRLAITGYGESGPLAKSPAYDSLIQGRAGMVDLVAHAGRPDVSPYWVVDKVVASFGVQAVLAALLARHRSGRGTRIALPMLDVMAYFNFPDVFQHRTFIEDRSERTPQISPVVQTGDGYIVITPVSGQQLSRLFKALDRPDLKAELVATKDAVHMTKRLYAHLNAILPTHSSAYWLELFERFDVPAAPVGRVDEHLTDAQVVHNEIYHAIDTPAGPVRAARYPATFGRSRMLPAVPPPELNAHGGMRADAEPLAAGGRGAA